MLNPGNWWQWVNWKPWVTTQKTLGIFYALWLLSLILTRRQRLRAWTWCCLVVLQLRSNWAPGFESAAWEVRWPNHPPPPSLPPWCSPTLCLHYLIPCPGCLSARIMPHKNLLNYMPGCLLTWRLSSDAYCVYCHRSGSLEGILTGTICAIPAIKPSYLRHHITANLFRQDLSCLLPHQHRTFGFALIINIQNSISFRNKKEHF